MVRTLPESTVDAWTAIELARARSPWIWLPTTNQGASWIGSHPGDVSSLLGGRLVIVENKGIEAPSSIDFGSKWRSQRAYLENVEEVGNAAAAVSPPLGWVFFGLPLRHGSTFGSDWPGFPSWHQLACPHMLRHLGVGGTAAIADLAVGLESGTLVHGAVPVHPLVHLLGTLRLSWLAVACDLGLAGLPLAATRESLFAQLRKIVEGARNAWPEDEETDDPPARPPLYNGDSIHELLQELAALAAAWSGHATLTVFPGVSDISEEE